MATLKRIPSFDRFCGFPKCAQFRTSAAGLAQKSTPGHLPVYCTNGSPSETKETVKNRNQKDWESGSFAKIHFNSNSWPQKDAKIMVFKAIRNLICWNSKILCNFGHVPILHLVMAPKPSEQRAFASCLVVQRC